MGAEPRVFLSAGVPRGARGKRYEFNGEAIADAVVWTARILLRRGARLVFGAQPAISPLILRIARDVRRQGAVEIFQSERYAGQVPQETLELESEGYGTIVWVSGSKREQRRRSLTRMRRRMLAGDLVAGTFIGGMDGVEDEFDLFGRAHPGRPRYVLSGPGGAALKLLDRLADTDRPFTEGAYPDYALAIADELGLPPPG